MASFSSDEQNRSLAFSNEVDRINADFYGRFPYPWRPSRLEYLEDRDYQRIMLCQACGDWQHKTIPPRSNVWVAGCGTNQAVITALNFPDARVLGSDLSAPSLALSRRTAEELSVDNLELRQESLNQVSYQDQFDYVLCTGVIHHNADPAEPLKRISNALKPEGILELMVYNRFHRTLPSSFQKAIRILAEAAPRPGSAIETELATALINDFPRDGQMKRFLQSFQEAPQSYLADALMQPLECNYTVESLEALAASCNLEMLAPCLNVFDKLNGNITWNLDFNASVVKEKYDALPDVSRWQITNLLLCESSPMLWFYFRRAGSGAPRQSEREFCQGFLDATFVRTSTRKRAYVLNQQEKYEPAGTSDYPLLPADRALAKIIISADGVTPMRKILERQGEPTDFARVNQLRLRSTTPAFPYLRSAGSKPNSMQ